MPSAVVNWKLCEINADANVAATTKETANNNNNNKNTSLSALITFYGRKKTKYKIQNTKRNAVFVANVAL